MKKQKLNNKGFTLIETTVCFILLGILLVAAAQVIASSTEVYYYSVPPECNSSDLRNQ